MNATSPPAPLKARLVVMTDISSLTAGVAEPDDTQSLVRLLTYANEFDIEGLIATSTTHGDRVNPQYIEAIVRAYGQVHGNLLLHDPAYPSSEYLLRQIKAGHPDRNALGQGQDTEASDWVIAVVDRPGPRPVWFTMWGGPRELAQALWKVSQTRSPEEAAAFRAKIRVHAIADQDKTGPWIKETYPDLFYITSRQAFRGMYKDGDPSLVTPEWVTRHVTTGHGPLGAAYPNYDGGDPWGRVKGIKEGDTPSYLYLMPNGLGDPMQPTWGSWGGRFAWSGVGRHYSDAKDAYGGEASERATVFRWRPAYQASFQARMDRCVRPYREVNHEPVAVCAGLKEVKVAPGAPVELNATGSWDPDGDRLSYQWSIYREAGSYVGALEIEGHDQPQARLVAPQVPGPATIHVLLTVTDGGEPPLCSYARVIIIVDPKV